MQLRTIQSALEQIAPLAYAEPWDNVGLLVGDSNQSISNILLTIDYTPAVAAEAAELHCDLVIAYHPPIFSSMKRITAHGPTSLIHDAIRRGVALYSPHTAWDATIGGTNDFLADALHLIDVAPLKQITVPSTNLKLVTFVPPDKLDEVASALFSAGAGHIGNYSSCSFRAEGTGTYFGHAGTHPSVGQPGRLESQPEVRFETVVPSTKAAAVIAALQQSHPYEEPAYDLISIVADPTTTPAALRGVGQGRAGNLPAPVSATQVIAQLKQALNLKHVLFSGDEFKPISRIAICAGAGGELLDNAIAASADLFLTGELRHHDAIKASRAGLSTLCTLHSNCERPSLGALKTRLHQLLPGGPPMVLSKVDADPFSIR